MNVRQLVLVVAVFGLIDLPLVYKMSTTYIAIIKATPPDARRTTFSHNVTYLDALNRRASADRYIILALVDVAFVDMAVNLYESSLRPNGIDNFLFVGVGRRVCEMMSSSSLSQPLPCHHYADDVATETASVYKSFDFIRKMNIRTDMIIEALDANFTVVHTDLDVFFFRNPLPHLKVVRHLSSAICLAGLFLSVYCHVIVSIERNKPKWRDRDLDILW